MDGKLIAIITAGLVLTAACGAIVWRFGFFIAPYAWTKEPARLMEVLRLRAGDRVADLGAGDGALAISLAEALGPTSVIYASELAGDRRRTIEDRAARAGTGQVRVVEGRENGTNLPLECCDAIYMRAVFHHLDDRAAFARSIAHGLKLGGRVAVIDFPPGALWFHGRDHGVTPEAVIEAFREAGLGLAHRIDTWGGGMFLLLFSREAAAGHISAPISSAVHPAVPNPRAQLSSEGRG